MRFRWGLLTICAVMATSCHYDSELPKGMSWDQRTGRFVWWGGEIRVPVGFSYRKGVGADSDVGYFLAPRSELVIQHDIGSFAGAYANPKRNETFEERLVNGSRVWIASRKMQGSGRGTEVHYSITFPDAGCANFFFTTVWPSEAKLIHLLAQSFRPKSGQSVVRTSHCGR